jgi:CHASE2 domain-containing sensor protein
MKKRLIKAVVYYLAIQLIYVGLNFIFNKPFLNIISIEQLLVADASLNDLHYQLQAKDNSKTTELSGKVILVNTGSLSKDTFRLALANTIKKINSFNPNIIAIDQDFSLDTSIYGTSDLQKAIKETQGILLAKKNDPQPLLDFGSSVRYGDVSFPDDQYTIRRYSSDTTTFAYIVSKHIANDGIKKLPHNNFIINYLTTNTGYFTKDSNEFLFYQNDPSQPLSNFLLIEAKDILQEDSATIQMLRKLSPGRTTLLGHLGDAQLSNILYDSEDRHPVPCDTILVNREETMSGLLIHANAIENIINPGIRFHSWSDSWIFTIFKHLFFLFFI